MSDLFNYKEFIKKSIDNGEDEHLEFKSAKNDFPKDAMETISSFANTDGGYIIFGISEDDKGNPELSGVKKINKVKDGMFDLLNQHNGISYNPIQNDNVSIIDFENNGELTTLIIVRVPKVSYRYKPIYIKGNDKFTYIRQGSSDYPCDRKTIESMIRDSAEEPFDTISIKDYTMEDLNWETVQDYRKKFYEVHSDHVFNKLNDEDFLIKINALRKSRKTKVIEPTVAGLLVFGKHTSIKEYLPHYNVEYINRKHHDSNKQFIDRLIYDGTWGEDNLYNFFIKTTEKLYLTLNETSELEDDSITRKSPDKLRTAIREALVNSIIHCDFQNNLGIIITRYSDNISFKNGGSLRISKSDFFTGGQSDPRNFYIQEIFRMVNLCEKAGSGVPKIMDAVETNKYRFPNIITEIDKFEFILWDTTIIDSLNLKNKTEIEIVKILITQKTATVSGISKKLEIHRNTTNKYLNMLIKKNIIERKRMGREYVYILSTNREFGKYNFINAMYSMIDIVKEHL